MSKKELVAALDEIAALDLPQKSRDQLEQMFIGPLAQKDPELALTKFIDRIHENHGMMGWQLANAMQEWAKKDPSSAIAWFDQQIAAGTFDSKSLDGKSQARLQFEGNLVNLLLGSDPDAAGRRLAALPEDQRDEALSQFSFQPVKEENQAAFAKLVRDQIPEKEQARTLARKASSLMENDDDYQAAGKWLSTASSGPAKNSAIRSYAETVSQYEPATAAQWAVTLPPGKDRDDTIKHIYENWPKDDATAKEAFKKKHGIE